MLDDQSPVVQTSQSHETPLSLIYSDGFSFRYAYARSADVRAADDLGQDYLTFQEGEGTLVFALCDGVSQSFYGDLAARMLGDALLSWLKVGLPLTLDPGVLLEACKGQLRELTTVATQAVQGQPLPDNIPPMLREVLEQKRAHGSESTFVCGRIDLPGRDFPEGRIVLSWMGDSRLRVWSAYGERTSALGDSFKTEERWSSARGWVGGDPHLAVTTVTRNGKYALRRLLAYSDGLKVLDQHQEVLTNAALTALIDRADESPTSDDISILEVWFGQPPANLEPPRLLAPQFNKVQAEGNLIVASWQPINQAGRYEVAVEGHERQRSELVATEWLSPPLSPGTYAVRVRAWQGDLPGHWSPPHQVVIQGQTLHATSAPPVGEPDSGPRSAPAPPISAETSGAVTQMLPLANTAREGPVAPSDLYQGATMTVRAVEPQAALEMEQPKSQVNIGLAVRGVFQHRKLALITGSILSVLLLVILAFVLSQRGPLHVASIGPGSTTTSTTISPASPNVEGTALSNATVQADLLATSTARAADATATAFAQAAVRSTADAHTRATREAQEAQETQEAQALATATVQLHARETETAQAEAMILQTQTAVSETATATRSATPVASDTPTVQPTKSVTPSTTPHETPDVPIIP